MNNRFIEGKNSIFTKANALAKDYSSIETYEADTVAASFIVALQIIDRTVLPREITFSNGTSSLKLAVAERRVRRHDQPSVGTTSEECTDLTRHLASICQRAPLRHQVRPLDSAARGGYRIAQLVNSQQTEGSDPQPNDTIAEADARSFRFDLKGWPVSVPADATAAALENAWRAQVRARHWLMSVQRACGPTVLIIRTSGESTIKHAIRASPRYIDFILVNSSELGHLMSSWKANTTAEAP